MISASQRMKRMVGPGKIIGFEKHILVLFLVFLGAWGARLLTFATVFSRGEITILGADSYYHARRILYTVANFPDTLTFDSYLDYPYGFQIGWSPLYDQASAFLAYLIGFGVPSIRSIEIAMVVFPVFLGTLTVLLVYLIASKIFDWKTGILGASILAILPAHVYISNLGYADHHVAEAFLSSLAYLFFISGLKQARAIDLSFADIKNLARLKAPLRDAVLSGIALGLSFLAWEGAPIFIGLVWVYALVQFSLDRWRQNSSDYLTIVGIVSSISALIIIILFSANTGFEIKAMFLSWFRIIFVLGILIGFVLFGLLSRYMQDRGLRCWYFLVSVVLLLMVSFVWVRGVFPQFYDSVLAGVGYLGGSGVLSTIQEAVPLFYDPSTGSISLAQVWNGFGPIFFAALIAFGFFLRKIAKEQWTSEAVFFFVWTAVILIITLYQQRFVYLLSVNISILAGFFILASYQGVGLVLERKHSKKEQFRKKKAKLPKSKMKGWKILVIIIILVILVVPNLATISSTAMDPPRPPHDWKDSLLWLRKNTPETSYYDDPNKTPEYGIMSWWDTGNWILYISHRPVVSNNFQTGLEDASRFFVEDNESEANLILERRKVRYIITDAQMVKLKFRYVAEFAGENPGDYYSARRFWDGTQFREKYFENERFFRTTLARLHVFDGIGLNHYRLIYESETTAIREPDLKFLKVFEYVKGMRIFGKAPPKERINITLNVITNQDRVYRYMNSVDSSTDGWYEVTVPYSTSGAPFDTRAIGNYMIQTGNISKEITANEKDVLEGGEIRVDMV